MKHHHPAPGFVIPRVRTIVNMANRFDLKQIGLPAQNDFMFGQAKTALAQIFN